MSVGSSSHKLLTGVLIGAFIAAYAAVAHYISTLPGGGLWPLLIAVVPALAMAFDLARRRFGIVALVPLCLAAIAAMTLIWPYLQANVSIVYYVQHIALNLTLGLVFARTLLKGRLPLCTFFAGFLHAEVSPALARYTRQVTVAWSLFFFGVAAISTLLFFLAPVETWSVFANLLDLPLVGLMFFAEHLVRRCVLPPEDQLGPTSAIRAYMAARRAGLAAHPGEDLQP